MRSVREQHQRRRFQACCGYSAYHVLLESLPREARQEEHRTDMHEICERLFGIVRASSHSDCILL